MPAKAVHTPVEIWPARLALPLGTRLQQHLGSELLVHPRSRQSSSGSPAHPAHAKLSSAGVTQSRRKSSCSSATTSAPTTPRLTDRALARSEALLQEMSALFESEAAGGPRTSKEQMDIAISEADRCTTAVAIKAAMPSSAGRPSLSISPDLLQEMAGFFESALESEDTDDPVSPTRRALRKTERLLSDLRQVDGLNDVVLSAQPVAVAWT